jgi:hypothetical protein
LVLGFSGAALACVPRGSEPLFFFFFARAQAGRQILLGTHAGRVFFCHARKLAAFLFLPGM